VLALEDLDTTTGPDVHVWLSAADVVDGRAGWFTAGSAEHVDLGTGRLVYGASDSVSPSERLISLSPNAPVPGVIPALDMRPTGAASGFPAGRGPLCCPVSFTALCVVGAGWL
jgi:hypothetical protein